MKDEDQIRIRIEKDLKEKAMKKAGSRKLSGIIKEFLNKYVQS